VSQGEFSAGIALFFIGDAFVFLVCFVCFVLYDTLNTVAVNLWNTPAVILLKQNFPDKA